MPELPEVTTTVQGIKDNVIGKTIASVQVGHFSPSARMSHTLFNKDTNSLHTSLLVGATFTGVHRRGKHILISLSNNLTLYIHLKMTGHLLIGSFIPHSTGWTPTHPDLSNPLHDPYNRHIRAVITFTDGHQLALCDARKFATFAVITSPDRMSLELSLGVEPLSHEFTIPALESLIRSQGGMSLKPFLLNQSFIAGLGNIYSDEVAHRISVHPLTPLSSLSSSHISRLHSAIVSTLRHGISLGGDSTSDYRNIYGERGNFHEGHLVYRRAGLPCLSLPCTGTIHRIVVGGRGTYLCDTCQKLI